jgi:hypothetical protein
VHYVQEITMIVLFLLLLLLTPAWSFAQDAKEPSLAEVARQERERRASMEQPARTITNANLKVVKGGSNGTAPSSVGTAGENDEGESQKSEDGKRDLGEATGRLEAAINRDQVLKQKMTELNYGVVDVNPDETGKTLGQERTRQLQETQQMLESNRKEIEAARKSLQEQKSK